MDDWHHLYKNGGYGGYGSGTGSILSNNYLLIDWLYDFINSNEIKSVLDVGCGDMQWMPSLINKIPDLQYTGLDYVDYLIESNKTKHTNLTFVCKNFLDPNFNDDRLYDLIVSKDVLHHCNDNEASIFLNNISKLNAKFKLMILPFNCQHSVSGKKIYEYQCDYIKCIYQMD